MDERIGISRYKMICVGYLFSIGGLIITWYVVIVASFSPNKSVIICINMLGEMYLDWIALIIASLFSILGFILLHKEKELKT